MKCKALLALTLWIAFTAIARAEIETYHFTGTVFNTHGSTFFGDLPVPPVGTAISGQFQYNSSTTAFRTASLSNGGTISVYPQNITGGFSATFGSISVVASSYNVNVYNGQQQYDGSLRDSFYVQWYSSDNPQPDSPLVVNGTDQSQYIFSMAVKYPANTWNDTSLPSGLQTSGFDTYIPGVMPIGLTSLSSSPIVNVAYYITSLSEVPLLRGDWNHDDSLTSADLNTMLGAITNINAYTQNLQSSGYSQNQCMNICDVNGDGKITNADIQAEINLLRNGTGGAAIVPEPASFVLLGIGMVLLIAVGGTLTPALSRWERE